VCPKYGCVMIMTTALTEKMNISVHVSGKGRTATHSDICMTAAGGDISVTSLIVFCNK